MVRFIFIHDRFSPVREIIIGARHVVYIVATLHAPVSVRRGQLISLGVGEGVRRGGEGRGAGGDQHITTKLKKLLVTMSGRLRSLKSIASIVFYYSEKIVLFRLLFLMFFLFKRLTGIRMLKNLIMYFEIKPSVSAHAHTYIHTFASGYELFYL